jgi:hypothetical protein
MVSQNKSFAKRESVSMVARTREQQSFKVFRTTLAGRDGCHVVVRANACTRPYRSRGVGSGR